MRFLEGFCWIGRPYVATEPTPDQQLTVGGSNGDRRQYFGDVSSSDGSVSAPTLSGVWENSSALQPQPAETWLI